MAFVSLQEGIDATTPAGKLQMHILRAIAEFERARIQERVRAGLARARAQGVRLGRPRRQIDPERLASVAGLPEREAARRLGIPRSTLQRWLAQNPSKTTARMLQEPGCSDHYQDGPESVVLGPPEPCRARPVAVT